MWKNERVHNLWEYGPENLIKSFCFKMEARNAGNKYFNGIIFPEKTILSEQLVAL